MNSADRMMAATAPSGETAYAVLERNYWKAERDVCVVSEINRINKRGDAEVICCSSDKNESWLRSVCGSRFSITKTKEWEEHDSVGKFKMACYRIGAKA